MELCGSRTIDSYFKEAENNTYPTIRAKYKELVQAVQFLHQHSVFHRDLSVKNVLVTQSNQIKIIDFGLATDSDAMTEQFCGTVPYFSPQIINKQPYNPKSTDIWCLGVILYVINFGYHPFGGMMS